jgi:hypothetical protein
MASNIIVLTTGLSGSSVVTSFLSRAGYWVGDQTIKKNNESGDYDTYENSRLVQLNCDIINSMFFKYNNDVEYHFRAHLLFEKAIEKIDDKNAYMDFIDYCNSKGNWIWKDPRLWITIGFWHQLLDKTKIKIIIVYRDPLSLWISLLNKRQIVSFSHLKNLEAISREELSKYLKAIGMSYYLMSYDELVKYPEKVIPCVNKYLDTTLSVNDLKIVYKGVVGNKTWNINKLVKSILIYIKNLHLRKNN